MPVSIFIISNVDWDISRSTKQSLLKYADDCLVILKVCPNYHESNDNIPLMDLVKIDVVTKTKSSDSVYVLDDDDALLCTPEDVPDGYDGIIYDCKYGDELLSSIDIDRIGVFFGYIRCVYKKDWLIESHKRGLDIGIRSCFDVFYLADLFFNGKYIKKNELICGIDTTPRTMYNKKYRDQYMVSLDLIKKYIGR